MGGGGFRIAYRRLIAVLFRGMALLRGVHFFGIDFVVPPGQAEIGSDHICAGMYMADHALTGRNGAREGVLDGMA